MKTNVFISLLIVLFAFGCSGDIVEQSIDTETEDLVTKSITERQLILSPWTPPGGSYRTMQIRITRNVSKPITVYFRVNDVSGPVGAPGYVLVPTILPARTSYVEVTEMPTQNNVRMYIDRIEFDGDLLPLYVDQTIYKITNNASEGFAINPLTGVSFRNFRSPYDYLGENDGGNDGGGGATLPPTRPNQ